ncbi:MAG: efflux RND transporter periplasmic adaptor subunit, partial [Gammaproteobacteria bacterium]|nr:efflux RND transporter periplasmic adaptor subunit [Gammaproteobacteria bacterium]
LNVEVVAPASLFGKIKVGMTGKVNMAPYLKETFEAKVVVVDKVIDAASRTLGIRLQMTNQENKIPAGVNCTVIFE